LNTIDVFAGTWREWTITLRVDNLLTNWGRGVGVSVRFRVACIPGLGLLLGACTTVFSSESLIRPSNQDAQAIGISYTLPKALIRGKVVVDPSNAAFVMCLLSKPVSVADAQQQYYMPFNNSPFSADKFTVQKDDTSGRLTSINVTTIDRFEEFAINLAKSAGALTALFKQEQGQLSMSMCGAENPAVVVLATFDIDPSEDAQFKGDLAAVNDVVLRFARQKAQQCTPQRVSRGKKVAPDTTEADEACNEYHRIAITYDQRNPPIRMQWILPRAPRAPKPDCSVGFCYRHTLPHTVQVAMAGSSVHSYTYQLPNASPVVAMDITRAITVTKTTKIEFGDLGQMTKIVVQKGKDDGTKGSEAEGLALLPMSVINAYFGALSETGQIIGKGVTPEKQRNENKAAVDQAEAEKLKQQTDAATQLKAQTDKAAAEAAKEDYAIIASNGLSVSKLKADELASRQDQDPGRKKDGGPGEGGPQGPGTAPKR